MKKIKLAGAPIAMGSAVIFFIVPLLGVLMFFVGIFVFVVGRIGE